MGYFIHSLITGIQGDLYCLQVWFLHVSVGDTEYYYSVWDVIAYYLDHSLSQSLLDVLESGIVLETVLFQWLGMCIAMGALLCR